MIATLAVGATLAGLLWQSHRALSADFRADLSAGLREAKEDRERLRAEGRELRADMNARMDRFEARLEAMDARIDARMNQMDARMDGIDARMDGIHGVLCEQGERLSRIEGMLHLHLGRNEEAAPPLAPAE